MKIRNVTLTGSEMSVSGITGNYCCINNRSADVVYASESAGADPHSGDVMAVDAGCSAIFPLAGNKLYVTGTGDVTLIGSTEPVNFFKPSATAGSGGVSKQYVDSGDKAVRSAIANRNLLDNPDFGINQRKLSGTVNAPGHLCDRWKLISGSAVINSDGSIVLSGTMSQTLEAAAGTSVTASANAGTPSYDNSTRTFSITAADETIKWAKLEKGSTATAFISPDPVAELIRCKRYYQRIGGKNYAMCGSGYVVQNGSNSFIVFPLAVPVCDGTISVSLNGTIYICDQSHYGAAALPCTAISGDAHASGGTISATFPITGGTAGGAVAQFRDNTSYIEISAEP